MPNDLAQDLEIATGIAAVPNILDVICRTTGMGFAAVARVTEGRWIACNVLDQIDFGLKPGGELPIESTICHEIRQSREPVVIDNVAQDEVWCHHAVPAIYGFQSYISVPIILEDSSFFGTLCAIDPKPAALRKSEVIGMFRLFAELIAKHIDARRKLALAEGELRDARSDSELREQFIAVLAHDLQTPLRAVRSFADLLLRNDPAERTQKLAGTIRESASRMQGLLDNLLDLARGRSGIGLTLNIKSHNNWEHVFSALISELRVGAPDRIVETTFKLTCPVRCDQNRISQLFSNLLGNALAYGAHDKPIHVSVASDAHEFQLSVANGGTPIPLDAQQRLFQPFYRLSHANHQEGLGLGLYISHEIAVAHGGSLEVTSIPEETRFTFRMPNNMHSQNKI